MKKNRAILADSQSSINLWDILARVLAFEDGEIRRCTATFLSCMVVEQSIRSEIVNKLFTGIFRILSGSICASAGFGQCSGFLDCDTKRHLTHAVALIAETHSKQIIQSPSFSQYLKTLTNLQSSDDNALRANVVVTLEYLKAH